MATLAYADIEPALRQAVPEFSTEIDEHLSINAELLPHALFGDLTRFTVTAYERGDGALVGRILTFLDAALRDGDELVTNLVAVSFMENVGARDPSTQGFTAMWPPALRAEAERQREWRPTAAVGHGALASSSDDRSTPFSAASVLVRSPVTTPDEITEYLGIEPTSTGWKGERLSSRNPRSALLDVNVWTFESPLSGAGSIEEQIDALLEVLVSEAHFDLLPGDCEVEIRVALTAVELGRLHNISAAAVKRAAAMGASISIDAYSREL